MPSTLHLDAPLPGTVVLRLDRQERLNAINEVMVDELLEACATIGADPETRVVVLTGAGRGFCSGVDMRDFGPSMPAADGPIGDKLRHQERMASLPVALRAMPQPVIAAVNGPAVGGGLALALAADLRLCGASASFANGAILVGLSGGEMGMSYLLPRIVGTSVAGDWMLTGRTVAAEEAHRSGLVSELVDDVRLMDRALELAGQIAANSPLGVQMTKRALQVNADAPDFGAALDLENHNQIISHATDDAAEARARWS